MLPVASERGIRLDSGSLAWTGVCRLRGQNVVAAEEYCGSGRGFRSMGLGQIRERNAPAVVGNGCGGEIGRRIDGLRLDRVVSYSGLSYGF